MTGNLDARKACNSALKLHKKYLKKVSSEAFDSSQETIVLKMRFCFLSSKQNPHPTPRKVVQENKKHDIVQLWCSSWFAGEEAMRQCNNKFRCQTRRPWRWRWRLRAREIDA